MNALVLIPFLLYFMLVLAIGLYARKFSSQGMSEFFIGGRKINRFVVALSAISSGRSAWLLLGFTGQAYIMGFSAIWAVVGYILVEFLLFLYYAPRIRNFAEKNDCITIPDYYAARFRDDKGFLRLLLVIIFIVFMVSYVASQFIGGGKAFYANFGLNQSTGIILTAVIILFYTLLGGFLAVSLTDVVQIIVMLLALLIIPVFATVDLGGFHEVKMRIDGLNHDFLNPFALSFVTFIGFVGIGLGSPGNPHIIIRYMSINDPAQFRWTAIMGTIWNILLAIGALAIGIMARAYFPNIESLPGKDPENAFLTLANAVLPSFLVGLVLASIFAAIMSTADSQLLIATSSLVRDLYEKILHKRKKISQIKLVFLSRIAIVLLVYIAIMLGLLVEKVIFKFVLFAWAGLGASIGPTSILALFWKKTSRNGVIAGLISGTSTVIIWKIIPFLSSLIYELIPGFIISLILTIIISLIDNRLKNKDKMRIPGFKTVKAFIPRPQDEN